MINICVSSDAKIAKNGFVEVIAEKNIEKNCE